MLVKKSRKRRTELILPIKRCRLSASLFYVREVPLDAPVHKPMRKVRTRRNAEDLPPLRI